MEVAVPSHEPTAGETLGALLARVRAGQGRSQLRVAELLCAAAGCSTVTRHEVSRWERDQRVPSAHWLRWLAAVLELPLDELERAAADTRGLRASGALAVGPGAAPGPAAVAHTRFGAGGEVSRLRALDDLVGGADLAGLVNTALRAALARARGDRISTTGRPDRRTRLRLVHLGELAQLAGWVNADAGEVARTRAAHRLGLRVAGAAGDRALVGHLLGTAAQLTANPRRSLELARAGAVEVGRGGSATARALLLQRVAYAAARTGDRRGCEQALAAADTMYGRRDPELDPDWVYWLTEPEFAALTGRCYARLGRPRLAVPLLNHALGGVHQPRSAAIYTGWLAQAQLTAGDLEAAGSLAGAALLDAVRSGSVRAARRARVLHRHLTATGGGAALARYRRLAAGALPYLADATGLAAGSGAEEPTPQADRRLG